MTCPYGIKYETESKDFWKYCYDCPHLKETDKSSDAFYCDLEEE